MADIAATDVTYSLVQQDVDGGRGPRENIVDATFGDGALTYPSGGVPLTKAQFGMPNVLEYLLLVEPDASNGFVYKFDASAESIRIYEEQDTSGALIELVGGVATPAAATLRVKAVGY